MKRDFLTLLDLSRPELEAVLENTGKLKAQRSEGLGRDRLAGRSVGMIFHKPSTRTRVSFQVGIHELGGYPLYMHSAETQAARGEPVSHSARVLSRYLAGVVIRTFSHDELEEFARFADVPVINALTDRYHPCQVLADLFTIKEKIGRLDGIKVAWIGDGNNMAHSWISAAARFDFELVLAAPRGFDPDPDILEHTRELIGSKTRVRAVRDPAEAVAGADVVNTDVWASMGQEAEAEDRKKVFVPYQVNEKLMAGAKPEALVLHCLPAHLEEEITESVLEGPQSVVFDQAENRLHAQKALLDFLM